MLVCLLTIVFGSVGAGADADAARAAVRVRTAGSQLRGRLAAAGLLAADAGAGFLVLVASAPLRSVGRLKIQILFKF